MTTGEHEIWIFGYGSLMWRPEFPYLERVEARVEGYNRCFCIKSTYHRGTPARPGLVLGLDRGGSCVGVAYRIEASTARATIAYLRERELIYGVYREARLRAGLLDGTHRVVQVLAYIVERRHPNYAGRLPLSEQATRIRGARGISGDNLDYLFNTVRLLQRLDIKERELVRLAGLTGAIAGRGPDDLLVRSSVAGLRKVWARSGSATPLAIADQRRFGHRVRMVAHW